MKKLADIVTGKASRKKLSNSEIILEPKIKQDLNDDKKTKLNEGQMIDKDYGIIHDPVKTQLNNIISHSNYHEARAIEHPKHGVFAWASEKATHDDVIKHLHKDLGYDMGKDEPTHLFVSSHKKTGELMLNKFRNPSPYKEAQEIDHESPLIKGIKHSSVQDYNTNSIHESYSENQTEKMFCKLEELAEDNDLDPSVLFEVFIRGVETWNKDMKITSEQYAFNRVHSFLNGGNAYYIDEDLLFSKGDIQEAFIRKMQIRTGILSGAAREVFGDSLAARAVYNAEHKIGHAIHHHLHKKEYAKQEADKRDGAEKRKSEREELHQKRRNEKDEDYKKKIAHHVAGAVAKQHGVESEKTNGHVSRRYHGAKASEAGRADAKQQAKQAAQNAAKPASKPAPKPLKSIISHAKRTPKPSNNN